MSTNPQVVDVIVVGSGPSGCAAALSLARARRTVLVITTHQGRNYTSASSHLWPTRDGMSPLELEKLRQEEIDAYPEASFVKDSVDRVVQVQNGLWQATTNKGATHNARKVILAMGLKDVLPDIRGVQERWGREVQSCLFCHGYEAARPDAKLVVIGDSEQDVFTAASLSLQHSQDVTLLTNSQKQTAWGPIAQAASMCISIVGGKVSSAHPCDDGIILNVEGERQIEATMAFVHTQFVQSASALVSSLGLELDSDGRVAIQTPPMLSRDKQDFCKTGSGATSVGGIFAAGEMTNASQGKQMIVAAAHGAAVGIQVAENLWEEDLKLKVGTKMQTMLSDPASAHSVSPAEREKMMAMAASLGLPSESA